MWFPALVNLQNVQGFHFQFRGYFFAYRQNQQSSKPSRTIETSEALKDFHCVRARCKLLRDRAARTKLAPCLATSYPNASMIHEDDDLTLEHGNQA